MSRRIVGAILLVLLLVGGFYWWKHRQDAVQLASGDFTCVGCMSPERKAAFEKENAGETVDGQSEHKLRTARADDAAGFPDGAPGNTNGASADGKTATANGTGATQISANQTAPVNPAYPAPTYPASNYPAPTYPASNSQGAYAGAPNGMPVADTVSPNPPNGMLFGGKGNFQWYRQGNLTWRVDTASGRSCIVYATMEEWQKQIVYSHGCGRNA